MTNAPASAPRSFLRNLVRSSIGGMRSQTRPMSPMICVTRNRPSNCPRGCSNNCRLPSMFVTGMVSFVRYNRRAAELWGRSPELGNPDERFCGSYRMFRPDGSLLPHDQCPMADVLRTGVSVRAQEVHIERPDGSRGIALVDIEVVKDSSGNIVGAVNCFQDITERKLGEEAALRLAAIIEFKRRRNRQQGPRWHHHKLE